MTHRLHLTAQPMRRMLFGACVAMALLVTPAFPPVFGPTAFGPTAALAKPASMAVHPEKEVCTVCAAGGEAHGKETVVAVSMHDGVAYYFCSTECQARFDANPAAFLAPRLPRPLPDLTLYNLDAEPVPLGDFRGKVMLLDFWATWCKPCVKLMPDLEKLNASRRDAGLVVVGASIDTSDAIVQKFLEKRPLSYPVLLDLGTSPAWAALNVHAIPATFLVNRSGEIVRQWSGKIDKKNVTAAIDSLLAAEPATQR